MYSQSTCGAEKFTLTHALRVAPLIHRKLTSPIRVFPNVLLLGATKSGTTTLANILWQHPAHVAAFTKEPMYLISLPNFRSNWDSPWIVSLLWGRYRNGHSRFSVAGYRKFFPTRFAMQRRRRLTGNAITCDCDPFNLYCAAATGRVASICPDARFIISLRNPIYRAFSDFNMHRTFVRETRTFAQALDHELSGAETRFRKRFLYQGVYAPHLERWFRAFSRHQFLVLRAEDLFHDAAAVARKVFEFLDLPPTMVDCAPRNIGVYSETIDHESEARLREYFRPFNERAYELLDRDMGWDSAPENGN